MAGEISLREFEKRLAKAGARVELVLRETLKDAGDFAHAEAFKNAPKSPTAAQERAARKRKWEAKHGKSKATTRAFNAAQKAGKKRRKAGSHSRPAPGGLENSIQWRLVGRGARQDAEIYVAANAPAGKYAKRIHDEKGKSWRNRGPGTVAKGARADDKFIERAVEKARKRLASIANTHLRNLGLV